MIIDIAMVTVMTLALVGVFIDRFRTQRGFGLRIIQFLAVAFLIPAIILLALHDALSPETVGALVGAVIGYVLSGIGRDE